MMWLRVAAVTLVLVPFVQGATRFWARRVQAGGRHLRVLEACTLGNDGRVYLVEVAGRVYALAAGAKGVQVIAEVEAPELLFACGPGEGMGGVPPSLPEKLAGWLSQAAALWERWRGGRGEETAGPAAASGGRAEALG
ncbi:MAG TPA: flagellar biosynthetic protein FliO, partial [Firmicutes bacterium]|nr:flagellar biosynthetic protein FliO [Bacillota bacterium]